MSTNDEIKVHLDHILSEVAKTQNIENYELNSNTTANYGDGFVAEFYTGDILDKDTERTISVAIKKAPRREFNYKGLFKNELIFYTKAFPALNQLQIENNVTRLFDNVPPYLSGSIDEPKKEYIAMENMKLLGYVMFDKSKFFDQEHLELIFKTYGKFHALSFVFRKKDFRSYENIITDIDEFGPTLAAFLGKQINSIVSAAVRALDKETHQIIFEEFREFGENAGATFGKSFEYNGEHKCFVHGDCWSNNMLFKYSEAGKLLDIKLIDFQLCRDGTPIHDLSYFFYSGASKKDFDNIEYYLQIYYKSLIEFAKENDVEINELFSFDVLVKEWKDNALLGIIFGIWLWEIKLTSKEELIQFMEDIKDMSEEEKGLQINALRERIHKSKIFKENTTSILIHAFEYGVLNKNKIVKK